MKCLVCEVQSKPNSSLKNRNFDFPLKYVLLDVYPERRTFLHLIHRISQGSRSCLDLCRRHNSHPQVLYSSPRSSGLSRKSLWKIEVFFLENENCNFSFELCYDSVLSGDNNDCAPDLADRKTYEISFSSG